MNQSGKHRVITFERTGDLALIREILTEPACWRRMTDDQAPPAEEFAPTTRPGLEYVLGIEDGRAVALFVLIERFTGAEIHFCFRPEAWGRAEGIARAFIEWVWRETALTWLLGPVPEHNRLALQLAQKAGFTRFGVQKASVHKRGRKYDLILTQIHRPDFPCRPEAGDHHDKTANPRVLPYRS